MSHGSRQARGSAAELACALRVDPGVYPSFLHGLLKWAHANGCAVAVAGQLPAGGVVAAQVSPAPVAPGARLLRRGGLDAPLSFFGSDSLKGWTA